MTEQAHLLDFVPKGATIVPELDSDRLRSQLRRVRLFVLDGKPHTLSEIASATGSPEASVSARLRDLRQRGYDVVRKRIGKGLFSYQVVAREG